MNQYASCSLEHARSSPRETREILPHQFSDVEIRRTMQGVRGMWFSSASSFCTWAPNRFVACKPPAMTCTRIHWSKFLRLLANGVVSVTASQMAFQYSELGSSLFDCESFFWRSRFKWQAGQMMVKEKRERRGFLGGLTSRSSRMPFTRSRSVCRRLSEAVKSCSRV